MPDNVRERLGVKGAMILDAGKNTSAEKAGLRSTRQDYFGNISYGDIVTSIDDKPINENDDLIEYFDEAEAGKKIDIKFIRRGKENRSTAVLQEL